MSDDNGKPIAYMRKWAFDGVVPEKKLNENGRWAWPREFQFLPVTKDKLFPDDIPLVAMKHAPA